MNLSVFLSVMDFKIKQEYTITTRSKCNIFKCKSEDYVQYIDTSITKEHLETIMNINFSFLQLYKI
jgi:hypothetical protein